ncbi:hypothetical protein H8356DRAFT_1689278 [Neocallimastix lanati (nom. inval.)]|jgi:hypothetical protein|uniref:Uncharacterized protein n=1 Tax=Neocallimastix californiae TaxID=1754190 RepID=A0A1Y2F0X4_9FUNG|nr:hypothetical protein H8356DRAFT_1689278 [Neocallimastix sp. JGI-2020a]ORY77490.1 hypothetical protein LY90DRAFT_665270 [Neocallimastix californiae]|eukprot:ORY77490.1 hypothetical protein LY90DRAFT_665270 [Neocallimastix californiae]
MVNYQLNSNIKSAMEIMFKECEIPEDRITELKSYIPKEVIENEIYPISHRIIKEVSDYLLKKYPGEEGNKYRFNNLIKSSKMILESPKPRVKSPELIKILENIKREQENKEYLKLTRDIEDDEDDGGLGAYASIAKKQITLVFNLFLSIAAGFTAGYVLGTQITTDTGKRALFGFLVAGVIGVAEGWFMMKDFLLLEKNEDGRINNFEGMELKLDEDGLPVIPQIKNNNILSEKQVKEDKKTV